MQFEFNETFLLGKKKIPVKFRGYWFAEEGEQACYHIEILVKPEGDYRLNRDLSGSRIPVETLKCVLERMDEPEWPSTEAPKIKLGEVDDRDLKIIVDMLHEHAKASYVSTVD